MEILPWILYTHTLFFFPWHLSFLEPIAPSSLFGLFLSHSRHTVPAVFYLTCSFSPYFSRWLKLSHCSCNQNLLHIFVDLQGPPQATTSYAHKNISLSCTPVLSVGLHTSPEGHLSVWRGPSCPKRSQKNSLSWVQLPGKYLTVFLKFSFYMEFIITGKRNIRSFSTWNGNLLCG